MTGLLRDTRAAITAPRIVISGHGMIERERSPEAGMAQLDLDQGHSVLGSSDGQWLKPRLTTTLCPPTRESSSVGEGPPLCFVSRDLSRYAAAKRTE